MQIPLAERLRPTTLDGFIGQEHLTGDDGVLMRVIQSGVLPSMIFWGPPGVGKTTLANIVASQCNYTFFTLSAINSGVKEVREVIDQAKQTERALLFIDEIHRFNKSQQDSLLGAVEKGIITLIGATTENPSFEVITPLLSRSQVYVLRSLNAEDLLKLIHTAIEEEQKSKGVEIELVETDALMRISGGDARKLLNAVELVINAAKGKVIKITNELVMKCVQQNLAIYDKQGEQHYDIISAFIKSIRGSDPNAAVYWLARMIAGGEDPKFIARRMLILASEDIGNANPNALLLAQSCFDSINVIGYPECRIILSQTAIYLASSAKSNASYTAIDEALAFVKRTGDLPVPLHIRNAPTKLMKELEYGKGYQYAHSYKDNFIEEEFLPDKIKGHKFYEPQDNPRENEIRQRLLKLWKKKYGY